MSLMSHPTGLMSFDKNVLGFATVEQAIRARIEVEDLLRFARSMKEQFDKRFIELAQAGDIPRSIDIDDNEKIYIDKKRTDRFDSEAIKSALGFTEEQLAVLPKNPAWKKTAILANEKTATAHYQDEEDVVIVKSMDSRFLK